MQSLNIMFHVKKTFGDTSSKISIIEYLINTVEQHTITSTNSTINCLCQLDDAEYMC